MQLQAQLENRLNHNMHNLGWGHKYYHMIFPTKIETFDSTNRQRHLLMSVRLITNQDEKLYTMKDHLMKIVYETNLHTEKIMLQINEVFGAQVHHCKKHISTEKSTYRVKRWSES